MYPFWCPCLFYFDVLSFIVTMLSFIIIHSYELIFSFCFNFCFVDEKFDCGQTHLMLCVSYWSPKIKICYGDCAKKLDQFNKENNWTCTVKRSSFMEQLPLVDIHLDSSSIIMGAGRGWTKVRPPWGFGIQSEKKIWKNQFLWLW